MSLYRSPLGIRRASAAVLAVAVVGCATHGARVQPLDARLALLMDPANAEWRMPAPAVSHLRVETTKGSFTLELVRAWGPIGADRLYNLARLGYYDNTRFHRVNRNYIAQFGLHGDPRVNATWKNQQLPDDPARSANRRGTFAFAFKAAPDTRNMQVFINLADNARNDAEHFTVLGTVIDGMPVLDSLYAGYGESSGSGMRQGRQGPLETGGNAYMDRAFPLLDRILHVTVTAVVPSAAKDLLSPQTRRERTGPALRSGRQDTTAR